MSIIYRFKDVNLHSNSPHISALIKSISTIYIFYSIFPEVENVMDNNSDSIAYLSGPYRPFSNVQTIEITFNELIKLIFIKKSLYEISR